MKKAENFDSELQQLANLARVISHPARLAILQYLAEAKACISGDITDHIPLSRTTVSQHLKELRDAGLIKGEIDGVKINYCLCDSAITNLKGQFNQFFDKIEAGKIECDC